MSNTTDIILAIFGVKATTNMIPGYVLAECRAECFLRAFLFCFVFLDEQASFFSHVKSMFSKLIGLLISGKCFAASF